MQFLTGFTVGVVLAFTAAAALVDLPELVNANTLPTWAQGIVALMALGTAIYIPREIAERQWTRTEAERRVRARAMAHLLFPELLELKAQISGRLHDLSYMNSFQGAFDAFSDTAVTKASLTIPITPGMERCIDSMHVMGEDIGTGILQLVALVSQHSRMIDQAFALRLNIQPALLSRGLRAADQLVDEALEHLRQLHDGKNSPAKLT